MKKYLLGITAVVFAIGLNAFTPVKKTVNSKHLPTLYYWYKVNSNGVTQGGCLNSSTPKDESQILSATGCPNTNATTCAFGDASNSITSGTTLSTPADPDAVIYKP